MSAASETRIFGVRLGVNPKWLVAALAVLAGLMFWYNSRGDQETAPSSVPRASIDAASVPAPTSAARARVVHRNRVVLSDRGTLRIRPIDATRGDVDPTLRLELLSRLQAVELVRSGRSLFEIAPQEIPAAMQGVLTGPKIPLPPPTPQVIAPVTQLAPVVNIPLKFYGFVRPAMKGENNRGLFLDGENILVASEGELLNHRYLIVELGANSARLEDTQVKQGQTLPVVPQATQQQ